MSGEGRGAVHRMARAFSGVAGAYQRARPDYPAAVHRWLAEHAGAASGRLVLDLAAGTGKLTGGLVDHGARAVAVEPVEGMRRALMAALPDVPVVAGMAEAIPLGTATVDVVTVAQAFHWFANDEAVAEIHRVLRAGGRLAVVWNRRDLDDPLQAGIEAVLAPLQGQTPSHTTGTWRVALEAGSGAARFAPDGELQVPWTQSLDVEGVVDRVASISYVAALPAGAGHDVLAEVRRLAEAVVPPLGLPYVASVSCYRRRP